MIHFKYLEQQKMQHILTPLSVGFKPATFDFRGRLLALSTTRNELHNHRYFKIFAISEWQVDKAVIQINFQSSLHLLKDPINPNLLDRPHTKSTVTLHSYKYWVILTFQNTTMFIQQLNRPPPLLQFQTNPLYPPQITKIITAPSFRNNGIHFGKTNTPIKSWISRNSHAPGQLPTHSPDAKKLYLLD